MSLFCIFLETNLEEEHILLETYFGTLNGVCERMNVLFEEHGTIGSHSKKYNKKISLPVIEKKHTKREVKNLKAKHFYEKNKIKILKERKIYYKENFNRIKENKRLYYIKNKEKIAKRVSIRNKTKINCPHCGLFLSFGSLKNHIIRKHNDIL